MLRQVQSPMMSSQWERPDGVSYTKLARGSPKEFARPKEKEAGINRLCTTRPPTSAASPPSCRICPSFQGGEEHPLQCRANTADGFHLNPLAGHTPPGNSEDGNSLSYYTRGSFLRRPASASGVPFVRRQRLAPRDFPPAPADFRPLPPSHPLDPRGGLASTSPPRVSGRFRVRPPRSGGHIFTADGPSAI
jgi:hypothetical protein